MNGRRALAGALLLAAVNLRLSVASVPPVLNQIRHTTGLSSAGGGLLTALPVFCFGVAALAAPRLIRRFSMGPLLSLTLVVLVGGCALRLVPSLAALFVSTVVIGATLAVGNVLVPGLIKRDFMERRVLMTAFYSVTLSLSATIASGLTVPIEHVLGVSWRMAIALWGAGAIVAVVVWTPHVRGERELAPALVGAPEEVVRGLWRDRLAWCVSGYMGLQSFGFYATLSWLPTILESHGMSAGRAGWMMSFSALVGGGAALATPSIERRLHRPWLLVLVYALACAAGFTGLLVVPHGASYLWCALLGCGQGASLALALGYIVARAPDSHQAAQLSTMAQSVGYLIACTGPFAMGALHGIAGTWTVPLIMLLVALVPLSVTGYVASQDRLVLAPRLV